MKVTRTLFYLLSWLYFWIVQFFYSRPRADSSISLELFFADFSGLARNHEAEEDEEEEHDYSYIDENIIENIRKVFHGTSIRNEHTISKGRRWV